MIDGRIHQFDPDAGERTPKHNPAQLQREKEKWEAHMAKAAGHNATVEAYESEKFDAEAKSRAEHHEAYKKAQEPWDEQHTTVVKDHESRVGDITEQMRKGWVPESVPVPPLQEETAEKPAAKEQ